jgi:hypothetical protein
MTVTTNISNQLLSSIIGSAADVEDTSFSHHIEKWMRVAYVVILEAEDGSDTTQCFSSRSDAVAVAVALAALHGRDAVSLAEQRMVLSEEITTIDIPDTSNGLH